VPPFRRVAAPPPGVYDEIVSARLSALLGEVPRERVHEELLKDETEVDEQLLATVRDALTIALEGKSATKKVAVVQGVLDELGKQGGFRDGELQLVHSILRRIDRAGSGGSDGRRAAPRGSLLRSGLVTNAQGESVIAHLASEFGSADRIDLLCSFIKLSGLDHFRPLIERHRSLGRPLRVLTTSYMRATELRAIQLLHHLGAEVRISYDESNTRLHAKAWLFHRNSDYSSAYVGSSNLSHAAQTEGVEWNVRLSQSHDPRLVEEMSNLFDSYWRDADKFEPFDGSEGAAKRLARALTEPEPSRRLLFEPEPREWQKPILRELEQARAAGRSQNLVVAATGTGKTLIAAFDFDTLFRAGAVETLLFVAHRREILEQAREAFRQVLGRHSFGELWVDGHRPSDHRHVFASVQSLADATLDPSHYHHVIIDEVHHAAAATYDRLLQHLRPRQLVGLTATPERADGRLYERHFPRPYVGNLRVWNAIPHVLVPFRYFVLDTDFDLSAARWDGGYVTSDLSQRLITAADAWIRAVVLALQTRIARPEKVRALAFCVDKAHARVVADRLTRDAGLAARALTDETPRDERNRAKDDLVGGRIQVLCVVDLFNEGVDIPDVNTLFLFRPTESATVFLQQIGRGLRRSRDKDMLTVFDVTGRQHPKFRFDRHLRGLLGHTPRELREFVETGHGFLPSGCTLQFTERAQRDLLDRLKRAVPSSAKAIRQVLNEHRDRGWTLAEFLDQTETDLLDLYRDGRSWHSLRVEVALATAAPTEAESDALGNVQKLLEVDDPLRLDAWTWLAQGRAPCTEIERRLTAMLFVTLYGRFPAARLEDQRELFLSHALVREELLALLPILRLRSERVASNDPLEADIPIVVHGRYRDIELAAAFGATSKDEGVFRSFYSGVEAVADGRFDLLLVTLGKGDVKKEHLRYNDFPLDENVFHWQSRARTRQDDALGRRHIHPDEEGVTPLLFVRDTKKDGRGVTCAFRFLGAVVPEKVSGERPISIEWRLSTPLRPEWVRRWGNVG
jgi:superfamily II DNA or RNA helicase/HKD family nuclease